MNYKRRTDRSQSAIVSDLRDAKVEVHILSRLGDDAPDLLAYRRRGLGYMFLEVKENDGKLSRGQLSWLAEASGPVAVVTNTAEALQAISGGGLSYVQKQRISQWLTDNPKQGSMRIKKFREMVG